MRKFVNRILKKGTFKTGILIFILSNIIVIGCGYAILLTHENLYLPITPLPYPNLQTFLSVLKNVLLIVLNEAVLILLGTLIIHLGFKKKIRAKNFSYLLKSTLYLSLVGLPFFFPRIYSYISGTKLIFYFLIQYPVSGVLSPVLYWFPHIFSSYAWKFAGIVHFILFLIVFLVYIRIISIIYNVSNRDGFGVLMTATLFLIVLLVLLSFAFPVLKFGGLQIVNVRIGSLLQ